MTITMEPTTKVVTLDGVPARIWEGTSDNGATVHVFVTRVAVPTELNSPEQVQAFADALLEQRPPSLLVEEWPLRLIL